MNDVASIQAQRIRDLGGTPTGDFVFDIMLEPTLLWPLEKSDE